VEARGITVTASPQWNGFVVAVDFEKAIVWIKWIGTHKAYDKIDVTEVRHGH
jgi:mRNA-degrading endonuclease HigB of HigAB toxin-antitoxin module